MVKNPPANAGDPGWIPGSGKSPGGGNGNPLQYSCLENPMERGAWWATVHRVAESDTTERLAVILPLLKQPVLDIPINCYKDKILLSSFFLLC